MKITGTDENDALFSDSESDYVKGLDGDDVIYGQDGDDTILGGRGNDTIRPGADNDKVFGSLGQDQIWYESGNDTMDGGEGVDTANFSAASHFFGFRLKISLSEDGQPQNLGTSKVVLSGFEHLIGAASSYDTLIGSAGDNWIWGQEGDDVIDGLAGDDFLQQQGGNATVTGGTGVDIFALTSESGVTVDLRLQGRVQATGAGQMVLKQIENLSGGGGHDVLHGDKNGNVILGSTGADTLFGEAGSDLLAGDGSVYVADETRQIVYEQESLFYGYADQLRGGSGADTLVGGFGADTLSGGADADTFRFLAAQDAAGDQIDLITDLTTGDSIDLGAIDANAAKANDQAFRLVGNFHGRAGEAVLYFDSATGMTNLLLDTDGDSVANSEIHLAGDQRDFTGFVW